MPIDKNEIENMVLEKYPFSEGEKNCLIEKRTMNQLRQSYRNRLYQQYQDEQANPVATEPDNIKISDEPED
jgi:hypothetical protein